MLIQIELIQRLLDAFGAEKGLRYVALDQGQCEGEQIASKHPAILPPALLIAPRGEEVIDTDKWGSRYRLSLDLRLFYDTARIANAKAPAAHKEAFGTLLTLLQSVENAARKAGFQYRGWRLANREESLVEYVIEIVYEGRNPYGD